MPLTQRIKMLALVITVIVAFLAGYIFHAAITKYVKAAEAKAEADAKLAVNDADQAIKKL
jgi:hypothetical protein